MNTLAKTLMVPEGYYPLFSVLVVILLIVVMLLKGLALWRSGRKNQKVWFWVLLLVNTVGILEIIYLLTNRDIGEGVVSTAKAVAKNTSDVPNIDIDQNNLIEPETNS